ncbi:uncharacterized protein LOC131647299 [Vicia villosa]|uniref:uncharacterized protein LOC131647299 n=1 Tax=Vicia villosa TaxID=3911 RepID=UPI00273C194C|nr:uncharacterized protein LOC131647299 [Vicia villosa]
MQIICGQDSFKNASSSIWWRDILKVSNVSYNPLTIDPIVSNCKFIVGNGFNTPFWESCWWNNGILKEVFPDLFLASSLKKVSVAVMGGLSNGSWKWGDLGISVVGRDSVFLNSFSVLKDILDNFGSLNDAKDYTVWLLDMEKGYTVASCYGSYASRRIPFGPPIKGEEAFNLIWKAEVPFKIKAFGWRLFLNRLPTKDLLVYRGMNFTNANLNCVFCDSHVEEADHLFFKCIVIKLVWKEIASWVGFSGWEEEECIPFFVEWHSLSRCTKVKSGKLGVFWLATTWIVWLTRNGICFKNEVWNINNMVWSIKFLVWRWSSYGNITHSNCCFYDFYKDPLSFMS